MAKENFKTSSQKTSVSLPTLKILVDAENCPELRYLDIRLDASTIPAFDTSTKSLRHNLEILTVGRVQTTLKCQIQVNTIFGFNLPISGIHIRSTAQGCNLVRDSRPDHQLELCQDARRVKQEATGMTSSMFHIFWSYLSPSLPGSLPSISESLTQIFPGPPKFQIPFSDIQGNLAGNLRSLAIATKR